MTLDTISYAAMANQITQNSKQGQRWRIFYCKILTGKVIDNKKISKNKKILINSYCAGNPVIRCPAGTRLEIMLLLT